ncbi:MAG: hypothetical protein ACLQU5_26850 [Isosphaeraceae bacterium]
MRIDELKRAKDERPFRPFLIHMAVIACAPVNAARYGMPAYTPPTGGGPSRGQIRFCSP